MYLSYLKNAFIKHAFFSEGAWIGLNDIDNEGQWHWISDSSELHYTNWLLNETNGLKTENCVKYCTEVCKRTLNGWNDARCHSWQGYVCERNFD